MPPLLLIDIGNTRVKWAVAAPQDNIRPGGAVATRKMNAEGVQALAKEFAGHRAVLSSVVPKIVPWFQEAFGQALYILTGVSPQLPLLFAYSNPAEIGADRIAAAVAAQIEGRFPVIIISCGTATAFTVLDRHGALCGGVIAPGIQAQLAALIEATAQLPAVSLTPPRELPAKTTQEAIRAGVFLNFQGGVKEIIARLSESLGGAMPPRIIFTGGHADYVKTILTDESQVRPLLVFEGLRIMGTRIFGP